MRIAAGMVAAALLTGAMPASGQEAMLGIYGAWVLESEDCSRVFVTENGRMAFASKNSGPLPGFIINSTGISIGENVCTVKDYKVRLTDVTFTGRCASGRRKTRQKFTIQELNGRYRIEVKRQLVPIKRCTPDDLNK
jgi:hypothetical protein